MHVSHVEDYLNNMAQLMPYPVFWTDTDSKVLGANPAGLRMMGALNSVDVLGKYPHDYLPADVADAVVKQINLVRSSIQMQRQDESAFDPHAGITRTYAVFRYPLTDIEQNVLGIFGTAIDITAEQDVVHLKHREAHSMAVFADWMEQVSTTVKELSKAVGSLKAIIPTMSSLSRAHRTRFEQVIGELQAITRNLRSVNKVPAAILDADEFNGDPLDTVLLSGLVNLVRKEKQNEFSQAQVAIQSSITDIAQFGFVQLQYRRLKRAIDQLVINAVAALQGKQNAVVVIKLDGTSETITLAVQDNGPGMNFEMLDRMLNRKALGAGHVRDTGMQLVWDMLEHNKGVLNVDTVFDQGTSIQLTFPRTSTADWIATHIDFTADSIIVVLDADPAMHDNWRRRFDIYQQLYPALRIYHCRQPDEALKLMLGFDATQLRRLHLLCDQEIPPFELFGLDLIETCKIGTATLFTDRYDERTLRRRADSLGVKIAPRELAAIVPLHCNAGESGSTKSDDAAG